MRKTTTKAANSQRFPAPACSRDFWIIDTESEGIDRGSFTARGPFPSVKAAEDWLREDAKETFLDADKSCRDMGLAESWAAPVHIVERVKTVEQVPEVEVRVKLKTIIPANVQSHGPMPEKGSDE